MQHSDDDLICYLEQKFVHPLSNSTPNRKPDAEFILGRDGTVSKVRGTKYMQNGDHIHTYVFFQDMPKFIEVMESKRRSCVIHNRTPLDGQIKRHVWRLDSIQEGGGAPWRVAVWK